MLRPCNIVALLMAWPLAGLALAADFTWTGAKSREWHDPVNWEPASGVPGKSDHAIIAGLTADTTITVARETPLGGLTFDPQARFRCTLEGETLVLGDGAVVRFKTLTKPGENGSQEIACPIRLDGRVEFRNENRWYLGAERLTLSGPISGAGELAVNGVPWGATVIAGVNTEFTGQVTIDGGATLLMANDDALGAGATPVRVRSGRLDLGSRITCVKNLIYEADAEWSGQTYCKLGGTVTVRKGATWQITNGGGCPTTLSALVEGEGNVRFGKATTLAGDRAATLTGVTTIGGETRLRKPTGVSFVAGPLVIADVLRWEADEQVADSVPLAFNGKKAELSLQGHRETLGTLDVQSDGTIDLGEGGAQLVFADSSRLPWKAEAALIVRNAGREGSGWRVGAGGAGHTAGQLAQVGFRDPAGKTAGTYSARIDARGELTPTDSLIQPVDLPIDMSATAWESRRARYDVSGLKRLGGPGTPLQEGTVISMFGDSITWGSSLVKLLKDGLAEGAASKELHVRVVNHGVNGAGVQTIRDGQDSKNGAGGTKPEPFAATIAADKATVAVIFIGVNDAWWNKSTPEEYGAMLRELVAQARANKTVPVLATPAMLNDSPLQPNAKLDAYVEVMREVARDTKTVLVDLRQAFLACVVNEGITVYPGGRWTCNDKLLNHDGVHSTGRGDQILAEMIAGGIYEALQP